MKQRCAALVAVLGRQRCWITRTLPKKIADPSWLLVITASHSLRCSGMSRLNSILADHSLIAKLRLPISPWLNCKLNRYMRAFQLCQQETYPYIFTAFVCHFAKKRTKKNTAPEPLLQATLHPAGHPPKDSKFRVKCRGSRWSCPRMFTSTFYGQVSHGFTIFPIQITGSVQQYSIFCGLGIYVVGQASIPSSWQIRCRYHIWIYIYIYTYIIYRIYNIIPKKGST